MNLSLILLLVTTLLCSSCMSSNPSHRNCSVAECINSGNDDKSTTGLCKNCIKLFLTDPDALLLFQKFQQNFESNYNFDRKKFVNLNADVLGLIFDKLTSQELLNFIKAYPDKTFSSVAKHSFKRRFKDYVMYIDEYENSKGCSFNDAYKGIITPYAKSAKMLRIIGDVIQNLDIKCPSLSEKIKVQESRTSAYYLKNHRLPHLQWMHAVTMQNINEYTRHTLKTLKVKNAAINTLSYFTKPFYEVEDLLIEYNIDGLVENGNLTFNQMFPKLRRFELIINKNDDDFSRDILNFKFISCEFPRLESFRFFDSYDYRQNYDLVVKFLEKNPQIRSFDVSYLTPKLCDAISDHLPNLQSLTMNVKYLQRMNDTTIEHVKHLEMKQRQFDFINKLLFPRLESLKIAYTKEPHADLIEFYRKHGNINRLELLHFYESENENENNLKQLNELQNLTEITLGFADPYRSNPINQETLSKLIATHQKLEKINLLKMPLKEAGLSFLQLDQFKNDWNIIESYYKSDISNFVNLIFEKKQ